jgi:hypothetical protein
MVQAHLSRFRTLAFSGFERCMMEVEEKKRSERRSQTEKVGRLKYNQQLLERALHDIEEVKLMQRTILAGLKGMFHFRRPMIQKLACVDEVDVLILDYLYQAGNAGLLPKDLAAKLIEFRVRRHQVSRRILRMNKRLGKEIGEKPVEKHGWHWVITSFALESWGDSEIDRQVHETSGDAAE